MNALVYEKSIYDIIKQVGCVHSWTSSFLTLSNRKMKAKSVQLPGLMPNPMEFLNNNDVTDDAEPSTLMKLPDSTTTSYFRLRAALLPVCLGFNVLFQELFEELEVSGDDISGGAGLVL